MHQGQILKRLRIEKGWTQHDLRQRLEEIGRRMSRSNVARLENNVSLEGDLIRDLSAVFGVPVTTFFVDRDVPPESLEYTVNRAFEFVRTDPAVRLGQSATSKFPLEAKVALIKLYEKYAGRKLLSDDMS
ncbi:MAG: helix-turn-helix domain-containing protein [Armatimonadetes bacterium]|nr:helix-turn-helix domain-containing protein [Armatimonadota bacterium]